MNRWHRITLALPLLAVAACDENSPLGSNFPEGRPSFTTTASGLPTPISNSVKYRDAGKKPGTGREGSASLMIRALMDKDREVELDITTGTEDDLNAKRGPGNLDKIQLKTFDPKGNHLSTVNYNKLKNGGFAQYGLKHLERHGGVQVQSNVSGIDPNRSDIVTVTTPVHLRPDLQASDLAAPKQARVQTLVNISAVVTEINMDVGARANCVLSVDGTEVDRASGIWVDAGGAVSCAFAHTFPSTGTKALRVAVTDVVPGDYDASNNAVTGTIDITSANQYYNYGGAEDRVYVTKGRNAYKYTSSTYNYEGADTWDIQQRLQSAWMSSSRPQATSFPAKMQIRHLNAGTEVLNHTVELAAPDWTYSWYYDENHKASQDCATRVHQTSGRYVWANLCSYSGVWGGQSFGYTSMVQARYAGQVSYHSTGFYKQWYQQEGGGYSYTWNYDYTYNYGNSLLTYTADTDYTLQTVLSTGTDYATVSTAELAIPLTAFDRSVNFPYTEFNRSGDGYTYSGFLEYTLLEKSVHGSAESHPTQ